MNIDFDKETKLLKKEFLQVKKRRLERHKSFNENIARVTSNNCFSHIDSQTIDALLIKSVERGVDNKIHYNYSVENDVEFNMPNNAAWNCESEAFSDECILLVPVEWYLTGGVLISLKSTMEVFSDISYFVDDDLTIYDLSLNHSLEFRGDRIGDDLRYSKTKSKGSKFVCIQNFWKEKTELELNN